MKLDKFVLAIIITIITSYFVPQFGLDNSKIPLGIISSVGVSLIFFFYGLKLSGEKLKEGLKNWKLHFLIQLSTFLLFPLIVLIFYPFVQNEEAHLLWLAIFFMAALPSTVSSSVVMVSIAKGNIPSAIFNATISGLIGIVVTPLWVGLFTNNANVNFDYTSIYSKLCIEIILPVIIGNILHRFFGKYAIKYNKQLSLFDKSVILLIIYKSFAKSFNEKIFSTVSNLDFILLFTVVISLFFGVYFFIGFVAKKLNFSIEDKITAQFCGTKKSLVHGTVFSKVLFGTSAITGFILLPIMLFHAIQILIISIIAKKAGNRS
ncbi:bile acid:sodium symporter family protein [Lutibacter sp.]|uniref:bile acid:sodium symporter family protein n=1 Tax=Lutibacter sp. TaxID=1925666 RepID=UPI001A1E1B81|nr:bile acid:sodium symporter family protein [Lutibacter sp.]MBI9040150.1 bile acid:sodium symporter [Lutibacter sp.]